MREHLNTGLELVREKKLELDKIAWLADTRKMSALFDEDITWIAEDWNVRMFQAGIMHIALIVPEDAFGGVSQEIYMEGSQELNQQGLQVRQFTDMESAKAWLREALQ
ncbi:hypothetical protein LVD17_15015 [Fulvivirga ulvae]|nr:hypothetical protein LVD17_15015 [Fulvivirga ulvae]